MDFCSKCGTHMRQTEEGLACPRCGSLIALKPEIKENNVKKTDQDSIYVVEGAEQSYVKVSRLCPSCGNDEAFSWFSNAIGEHAGVRQERTTEHFRCTKCASSWVESL